jgi:hypothetical protein
MWGRVRQRVTYANVMSTIAVFIALGGVGAYAANEWNGSNIQDGTLTGADIQDLSLGLPDYGANSISTGKLKDQDVRTADLRDLGVTNSKINWDSVTSGKVLNNNLTGDDINESTLVDVVKDYEGVKKESVSDTTASKQTSAICPAGKRAISGGWTTLWSGVGTPAPTIRQTASYASSHAPLLGWTIHARNDTPGQPWMLTAIAQCVDAD